MKKINKDIIIVGFALFAMFFGAGNLLFPPFLGLITGKSWLIGFSGFILADVGLSLLAILAIAKCSGEVGKIFSRAGHKLSIALACAIMICIGPLLAIPRTAATTFEMGIQPIFNNFNAVIFSVIFFAITLLLTIKPSKVVDIIGSYLTPALLIALLVLIGMGIFNPLGNIEPSTIDNVFSEGIFQGYQTLDALGAVSLGAIVITSIANKGYTKKEEQFSITFKAGLVAGAGKGGPVTLTDANIERYFMTIPEAAQLVLQAGALAESGSIYVLDMGEPVKIMDLAKQLIRFYGYEPGVNMDIKIVGLRPGEKLYEELMMDEEQDKMRRTVHNKIFVAPPRNIDLGEFYQQLQELAVAAEHNDDSVVEQLAKMVPTFTPTRENLKL